MTTRKNVLGAILLCVPLLTLSACGDLVTSSSGSTIEVTDITSPLTLFAAVPFTVTGEGFLSAAGTDVTVRFTATSGTPFDGGTSDTAEVAGTVVSNTEVTGMSPTSAFVATFDAYVTVILPSTAQGTSETPIAAFIGAATEATDDSYATFGNTRLERDAANGLLVNDAPTGFVTVIDFDAASTMGGTVAVDPDGAFAYDPAPGFEGVDTFTYEIGGGTGTDTATVTVTVSGTVWFIDATAAPGGDGRFATPFDDIAPFMAIQGGAAEPGDTIFIYEAGGLPYTGPLTLLANQILLGQGVALEIGGEVIVPATSNPLLTGAGGVTLTLATNNRVAGLDVGNTGGAGIEGNGIGPIEIDLVNVATVGGPALDFDGVNATVAFGTVSSTNSANFGVALVNIDGTVTVSGRTTVTSAATTSVYVAMGSGDITFHGMDISTTGAFGLIADGTCTVNVVGSGNTISTTTGQPLVLLGTIGSSGITFESVSCDGAVSGIDVVSPGTLGSLTITGDGTGVSNGSGGTLRNCSANAITVLGAPNVSLSQLDIDTSGSHGIQVSDSTNFLYEDASIVGAGDSDDEYGIWLHEAYGDVLIEDVEFDDINETAIRLDNAAGDDSAADVFTFRRVDILDHTPAGFGENGIDVVVSLLGDVDVLIDDCTFDINGEGGLGVLGVAQDTAALDLTITNSTFDAGDAFGSGCIQLQGAGSSQATFNVLDNDLNLSGFTSIIVNNDDVALTNATISGNDIDADAGSNNGYGISLRQDEDGDFTVLLEDNTVDGHGFDGIRAHARDTTDGTGTLNVTLFDNTVGMPFSFGPGINLLASDTNTLCCNVSGNDATGSNLLPGSDDDIVIDEGTTATVRVTQLAPTPAVDPSEIDDANNSATVGVAGTPLWGQGACPVPPVIP